MANYTDIQQGDLDDAAIISVLVGHENLADYVHSNGVRFRNFDWTLGTFDTTSGKAFVLLDEQYAPRETEYRHDCLIVTHVDPKAGVTFDTTMVNHVYLNFNVSVRDSPKLEVETSTVTNGDWLKIAEIDPAAAPGARVTRFNENPSAQFEDLITDTLHITNSVTWPDGTTTSGAPLTADTVLFTRNDYYDDSAADPPGVVRKAASATRAEAADYATLAGNAETADYADGAGKVGDLTQAEIEALVANSSGEWTRITNSAIVDSNANTVVDIDWHTPERYDRYLVTVYIENHTSENCHAYLTVNDHTRKDYLQIKAIPPNVGGGEPIDRSPTNTRWSCGEAMPHAFTLSEFEVICPRAVVKPKNHYPVMSMGTQATGPKVSLEITGQIRRSMDEIRSLQLWTDSDATAKVVVKGQDLL